MSGGGHTDRAEKLNWRVHRLGLAGDGGAPLELPARIEPGVRPVHPGHEPHGHEAGVPAVVVQERAAVGALRCRGGKK